MRFFRFRKLVSLEAGKYLRYAIGEIILVVIGILVALQVNNWNEHRKEKAEEKKILLSNLDKVISDIKDFQKNEGFEMGKDIELRLDLIDSHLKNIVELEPIRIEKIREKLLTSIQSLKIEIDTNRFEQEMIFYLEKFDITEEKVRLMNHIKYFRDVTNENSPNGKKLGFISQEMGREINTIGSKANDAHLQKIVVQMKNELEKIKEQLLNIL